MPKLKPKPKYLFEKTDFKIQTQPDSFKNRSQNRNRKSLKRFRALNLYIVSSCTSIKQATIYNTIIYNILHRRNIIMTMRDTHFYSTPHTGDLRNIIYFFTRYTVWYYRLIDPRTDGYIRAHGWHECHRVQVHREHHDRLLNAFYTITQYMSAIVWY